MRHSLESITAVAALAALSFVPAAMASTMPKTSPHAQMRTDELTDAQNLVDQAVGVVDQMKKDPHVKDLLARSKGVVLIPKFGKGALVVGVEGGDGILLAHRDGRWSDPAFVDLGGVSLGAQAGGSAGSLAMILMSDRALDSFRSANNWSLNANSGVTIVNYSARAQATAGKGDIVLWADTEGALAEASISVSDINHDEDANRAFYGRMASVDEILAGKVMNRRAQKLQEVLPS